MATANRRRVSCTACGWRGFRTFVPEGELGGGRDGHAPGFGVCRSCRQPTLRREAGSVNDLKRDARARADLRRYAPVALVLLLVLAGCRRPGHFTDSTTTWDAVLRAHPETGCGYVAGRVPGKESSRMIPVYHRNTGHIAFFTRYAWCPGNQLYADDVAYPLGFMPRPGDIVTCAWDGEGLDPQTDLEIKPEDRPR